MAELKKSKRDFYLNEIKKISSLDKSVCSEHIAYRLHHKLQHQSGCWAGFKAFSSEPKFEWSQVNSKIEWCFPVLENQSMHFENIKNQIVDLEKIEGFVIPGLAFDQQGVRLGRGGGHYDRTLANHNGPKIGVCFNVSFCQELPGEAHDIRFSTIVTDQQIFEVGA